MPSSGGGGSHGGGFHSGGGYSGGSHSGGRHTSGGTSQPVYRRTYYPGAIRFVYYDRRGRLREYYGDRQMPKPGRGDRISLIVLGLFLLILGVVMGLQADHNPKMVTASPAPAVIADDAGLFPDPAAALKRLQAFTEETGICVCLTAAPNEAWQDHYASPETYAYELYVKRFDNEDSLLILYTEPGEKEADFKDWYFELMVGDNVRELLTEEKLDELNGAIQIDLIRMEDRPEEAISLALESLGEGLMDRAFYWGWLIPALLLAAGGLLLIGKGIRGFKDRELAAQAVKASRNAAEKACEYCGTRYVEGTYKNCRSCGAPLK